MDDDFKYLTSELGPEILESFKRFNEEKLPDKKMFLKLSKRWNNCR